MKTLRLIHRHLEKVDLLRAIYLETGRMSTFFIKIVFTLTKGRQFITITRNLERRLALGITRNAW